MHRATLGHDVAGMANSLDRFPTGGLAFLDLVGVGLGGQETELARDDDNVVGRGGPVLFINAPLDFGTSQGSESTRQTYKRALSIGSDVDVVHVQSAGEDNADAGDFIERNLSAVSKVSKIP
jgi:hypothetical protein